MVRSIELIRVVRNHLLWCGINRSDWEGLVSESCPDSNKRLILPEFFIGDAGAGKRVKVTPSEYAGTQVYHTLYLPSNWNPKGTLHS